MKILIKESQLDKLVDQFITREMEGIVKQVEHSGNINMQNKIQDKSYGYYNKRFKFLHLNADILNSISNMLNIPPWKVDRYLIKWMWRHWNIPVDKVFLLPSIDDVDNDQD